MNSRGREFQAVMAAWNSLPSSMFGAIGVRLRSKRACSLSRLGIVSTTWRCATGAQTPSATCSAVTSVRFCGRRDTYSAACTKSQRTSGDCSRGSGVKHNGTEMNGDSSCQRVVG